MPRNVRVRIQKDGSKKHITRPQKWSGLPFTILDPFAKKC